MRIRFFRFVHLGEEATLSLDSEADARHQQLACWSRGRTRWETWRRRWFTPGSNVGPVGMKRRQSKSPANSARRHAKLFVWQVMWNLNWYSMSRLCILRMKPGWWVPHNSGSVLKSASRGNVEISSLSFWWRILIGFIVVSGKLSDGLKAYGIVWEAIPGRPATNNRAFIGFHAWLGGWGSCDPGLCQTPLPVTW